MLKQININKSVCLLLCFINGLIFSQSNNDIDAIKKYYVVMTSEFHAPHFKTQNGVLKYTGDNLDEKSVFDHYEILKFEQVYSRFKLPSLRSAFYLETTSKELPLILLDRFPLKYKAIEDITDEQISLSSQDPYQPDDFVSSEVRIPYDLNTFDRSELEYINAPKAWGITNALNPGVLIGISDAKVNDEDEELNDGKVQFVGYNAFANLEPECHNADSVHGTGVSVIAAGKGNNGAGTTGLCYECNILATPYTNGQNGMNGLLALAQHGARVINMSWGFTSSTPPNEYKNTNRGQHMQTAINNIVETYGVVMVAAAGNHNAFEIYAEDDSGNSILIDHTETPISYDYPASLDHVISVSGVNHWYTMDAYPNTDYDEVLGTYYRYIEDSVSPYVNNPTNSMSPYGIYINPWIFEVGFAMLTLNENVDILAPGYQLLSYSKMAYDCIDAPNPDINTNLLNGKYTSSTSQATPYVTGTIGLMFTVDECLTPTEVESILKLTAKDIESNPMNVPFAGYIGAGKLETGNAVEFVNEMNKTDGVAVIKDHLFYRFNFAINRFQNHLTLDNVAFVEDASVTFKAKNTIELIKNVTLIPNSNSFIDLEIDSKIDKVCNYTPPIPPDSEPTNPNPTTPTDSNNGTPTDHDVRLSPNPTRAVFSIELDYDDDEVVEVILHNAMGQQVLHVILNEQENINVTHLDTGIYSVKIFTLHNHIFSKQLIKF